MKILQVINSLHSGGAEKLVSDLCIAYLKSEIHVELALLSGKKTSFLKRLNALAPNLTIHTFDEIKDMYDPRHVLKLRKLLAHFDIVHVHLFPTFYWVGLASFLGTVKAKLVYTEHNTTNRRRNHMLLKHVDKIIYARYSKVISISDAVHLNLELYLGPLKNRLYQINNGIDLREIKISKPYWKEDFGFQESDILMMQVSSFTPQKDQKTLIKSLLQLPRNIHLILVGEGPLKEEHESLAKSLNLLERVHFFGLRSDVPRLLKTVDFVVLSSNFEGLSLSCVEGMASGRPFLASDVPGLTEVVKGFGILFPKGDETTLAKEIARLLTNGKEYSDTVDKCLQRAAQFDIRDMVTGYLDLYRTLLNCGNVELIED